jgi:hypothetical protein
MPIDRLAPNGVANSEALRQGVVYGLLISIPLWACVGIGIILLILERPFNEAESAVLMVAAIVELILLRHVWREFHPKILYDGRLARAGASVMGAHQPLLKQTSLLAGVVGAYLHYYFWDVQLQIAALPSVTVFVPVQALG